MEPRIVRRVPLERNSAIRRGNPIAGIVRQTGVGAAIDRIGNQLVQRLDKHSAKLLRAAGIAGIIGGVLWALFVIALHLQTFDVVHADAFYSDLYYKTRFENLLAIPLLFFICTALGMLTIHSQQPKKRWYVSILLIFAGLGLSAFSNIYNYWLDHRWDPWGSLGPDAFPPSWIEWWLPTISVGLFIFAVGFVLLLSAKSQPGTFAEKWTFFLGIGLLLLFPLSLVINGDLSLWFEPVIWLLVLGCALLLSVKSQSLTFVGKGIFFLIVCLLLPPLSQVTYGDEELVFGEFGLVIWLLVLFGFAWIFIGASFLRQSRNPSHLAP